MALYLYSTAQVPIFTSIFASNLYLGLKNDIIKQEIEWGNFSKSYNERSNIPQKLVIEIFTKIYKDFLRLQLST